MMVWKVVCLGELEIGLKSIEFGIYEKGSSNRWLLLPSLLSRENLLLQLRCCSRETNKKDLLQKYQNLQKVSSEKWFNKISD